MALPDYSGLAWIPLIRYTDCGATTELVLTFQQRLWSLYSETGSGGADVADSGVGEARVYRHDVGRVATIRFTEEEWPSVDLWLRTVQAQWQYFTFQFDSLLPSTAYSVALVAPQVGDRIAPRWVDNIILELDVTMRTEDGSAINLPFNPRS